MGTQILARTLPSGAREVTELAPSSPLPEDNLFDLGNIPLKPGGRHFVYHRRTQAAGNVMLTNAAWDQESGLFFQDDEPIPWLCYPAPAETIDAARERVRRAPTIRATTFAGYNRAWDNHGHWLTQCVPAIHGYTRHSAWADAILELPALSTSQWHSLALTAGPLPATAVRQTPVTLVYQRLCVSSMLKPQTAPSSLARDAHARMRDRIGQDNGAAGASLPSLLYIARTDTQRRPLVNEPAVIAMLSALGVEAVVASSLTLEATIALFSRAKLVIGAHGAGMANIAFCRPGCVVYEWHPEHYLETIASTATALVARQSGLHYWADAFPSHGSWAEHGHNVPWSIDLPYLCRRLGQINCIHDLGLPTGPVAPA